jgi:hypothetical protein
MTYRIEDGQRDGGKEVQIHRIVRMVLSIDGAEDWESQGEVVRLGDEYGVERRLRDVRGLYNEA